MNAIQVIEKVKVSELIAQALEDLGIEHIFGIVGAGNVSGALLTTGAGSTNGVTGVVSAWADSIPGIIIAGNENSKFTRIENTRRMWGVQGYDSVDMVRKVTKYAHRVTSAEQATYEIYKAAYIALDQRPGPCWIEIPMDIQSNRIDPRTSNKFTAPVPHNYLTAQLEAHVESVVEALVAAQRPLLWLGNGIRLSGAEDKIAPLLDLLGIPALVSWAGIDMIDSRHPLVFGRAGVYGQRAANFILQNCDYLLTIGTRLAIPQIGYDLSELARGARIDVIDIDPLEASKHQARIQEMIVCDAGTFMGMLIERLQHRIITRKTDWLAKCNGYQDQFPCIGPEHDDTGGFMNSYRFMERLNTFFKKDQIVVTDMGTALLCGHQVLAIADGQRMMTSTGLGEMGYGLPAAIGASFATDCGEVMCLNCDGGMMLNLQELQTIVHHKLPIKLFIFNNDGYLMIKHTQNALFKTGYVGTDNASGISCADYSKIAIAFDIPAFQIHNWEECDDTLAKVQAATGPIICEVFMHPEQLFAPKLSLVVQEDGTLVSPPLEDLTPLLPRDVIERAMLVGIHEKSKSLQCENPHVTHM